jgi:hypothetical protein
MSAGNMVKPLPFSYCMLPFKLRTGDHVSFIKSTKNWLLKVVGACVQMLANNTGIPTF